mgnify:CR=1 FL=1
MYKKRKRVAFCCPPNNMDCNECLFYEWELKPYLLDLSEKYRKECKTVGTVDLSDYQRVNICELLREGWAKDIRKGRIWSKHLPIGEEV